jgi:Ala-tRNA(Pro) deacylase
MTAQTAPETLVSALERASVPYELITHERTTSAVAEARVLDVDPHAVAKTIVLEVPGGFARAVLPASERLDLGKVRAFLDTREVELASEEVLEAAYPDFEVGAVPPLLVGERDRVLVDRRLLENDWVLLEAGTHEQSLRVRAADLVALSHAHVIDLSRD